MYTVVVKMIFWIFLICITWESMWLGLVDQQKKTKISFSNWNLVGNDLQYVARPFISQNSSCPKSRLLCTQKKRIRTTVSIFQKVPKMGYITQRYNFSVRCTRIFFSIAALNPWFEFASLEYKEAYFSDNLNFDL